LITEERRGKGRWNSRRGGNGRERRGKGKGEGRKREGREGYPPPNENPDYGRARPLV